MPKRTKYPGIKARGNSLHFQATGKDGNRITGPSGLRVGQEKEAAAALAVILRAGAAEAQMLAQLEAGEELPESGVTVKAFGGWWNKERLGDDDKKQAATEDAWKLGYINEFLGHVLIGEFRTKHGIDFVKWLKKQEGRRGKLGHRTVRSIWSCLHYMFRAAVRAELIPVNPCVLEQGDLPAIEDKDPEWRDSAVFERYEVESLISDERIPEWHRVLWALLFLSGTRPGEAFALPWMRYDTRTAHLGRLTLMRAWSTRYKKLGKTKTKKRRLVPVHPTLARILARWKLAGWQAHVGRPPKPEDFVVPNRAGEPLRSDATLELLRADLATLGLRTRQQYDARRTFKSLAEADGASPELLRWVMWGSKGDVADGYTAIPWAAVCAEVAKLRVEINDGKLLELRSAVGAIETVIETVERLPPKSSINSRADIRNRTGDLLITNQKRSDSPSTSERVKGSNGEWLEVVSHSLPSPEAGSTVSLSHPGGDVVLAGLESAAADWRTGRDAKRLRKRLTALLYSLDAEDEGGEP